jgi:hypothetical protein
MGAQRGSKFDWESTLLSVIPAQAGIQTPPTAWIPFFNGMTDAARATTDRVWGSLYAGMTTLERS